MTKQELDRLVAKAEGYRGEIVEFCGALVKTPSVNGVNPEGPVARLVFEKAKSFGLQARYISKIEDRPNVLVEIGERKPCLLFLAHMDTVPPGDERHWKFPPFSGAIEDRRLYGRGAIDTKGGLAAALFALKCLVDLGLIQQGKIQFVAVSDEESGANSEIGLRYVLDQGLIEADSAVYAYPNSNYVLSGHRGYLRLKATAHGEAVHTGSLPWERNKEGSNAVTGLAEFLLGLERLRFPRVKAGAFEGRRTVVTPGTLIEGGVSINVVPERCEAWIDARLTPDHSSSQLLEELRRVAHEVCRRRPRLQIEFSSITSVPAAEISADERIVKLLQDSTERILGKKPQVRGAGPANEGYMLINAGIPTVCGFGPDGDNAHAANEFVDLQSLINVMKVYALTAAEFLEFPGDQQGG